MTSLSEAIPIPQSEHVMVHARLKTLGENAGVQDYRMLAIQLLDCFRSTDALSIVVPTFTYTFTDTHTFSVCDSPSEVGRFSEEVRQLSPASYRTTDPVFSVVDVDNFGWPKSLNLDAFGDASIWRRWAELNAIIVNLDLPHIVATQFHFIEKLAKVPYRYEKTFSGKITDADQRSQIADYGYYVRDLNISSTWNRQLLENELRRAGKLHEFLWHGLKGMWFRAKEVENVLLPIMSRDPQYLLAATADKP